MQSVTDNVLVNFLLSLLLLFAHSTPLETMEVPCLSQIFIRRALRNPELPTLLRKKVPHSIL